MRADLGLLIARAIRDGLVRVSPADAALWAKVARELDKAAARPPAVGRKPADG